MEVISRALKDHREAITVSTLKEAEFFFSNKIIDILYAVGIAPNKLAHVADLRKRGADLAVVLDSAEAADMLAQKGEELGVTFPALVEIDSDGHRSGVQPNDPALIDIATRLHERACV